MDNNINIYLVEDDNLFRELVHDYLELNLNQTFKKVKIRKFSTGERLLKELQDIAVTPVEAEEKHIVVLDYKLAAVYSDETLNGLDILLLLKKLAMETTVIVVSAQEDIAVVDQLLEAGAADYIVKGPNAFPRLLSSVRRSIERLDTSKKDPQVLYQVVYRDQKKKTKSKKFKRLAVGAAAFALLELVFILLLLVKFF